MQTQSLLRNCTILSALALAGCPSDEEGVTGTASNSGTESDTENTEDSDEDSDSEPTGSNSNSDSNPTTETTDNPTTVDTTEDPTDPTGTTDPTDPTDPSATESDTDASTSSASASETDPSSSSSDSDSDSNSGSSSESSGAVSASASDSDSDSDSDTNVDPGCEAPGELIACDALADAPTQFQAIGLGCDGDANQVIPISNAVFNSAAGAWRVATQFGTFIDPLSNEPLWGPREGEQLLIISTGAITAPNAQTGIVTMGAGAHQTGLANANPDGQNLPAPMSPVDGGQGGPFVNCDGVGDCSNTVEAQWDLGFGAANDLLWMQFDTAVPGGTNGFSFDFAYFSAEFPEWVDTSFNDMFLAWSASETYTGNLCFINDQPCTVTALCDSNDACPDLAYCDEAGCANVAGNELAGTGFDGVGGSTGWFTANGSAAPGEDLQLTFAIFDMGDSSWDTAVLLDNWRWDCEGCVPSEVMGCGIEPTP